MEERKNEITNLFVGLLIMGVFLISLFIFMQRSITRDARIKGTATKRSQMVQVNSANVHLNNALAKSQKMMDSELDIIKELKIIIEEKDRRIESVLADQSKFSGQIKKMKNRLGNLESKLKNIKKENRSLKKNLSTLKKGFGTLEEDISDLDRAKELLAKERQDVRNVKRRIQELKVKAQENKDTLETNLGNGGYIIKGGRLTYRSQNIVDLEKIVVQTKKRK